MALLAKKSIGPTDNLRYIVDYGDWLSDVETLNTVTLAIDTGVATCSTPVISPTDGKSFSFYVNANNSVNYQIFNVLITSTTLLAGSAVGQTKHDSVEFGVVPPGTVSGVSAPIGVGPAGPQGVPGPAGAAGVAGSAGAAGAIGAPGSLPAEDGDDAWTVPVQGNTGNQGSVGAQGPVFAGIPGEDGDDAWTLPATGPQGSVGPQGPALPGATGEDGDDAFPSFPPGASTFVPSGVLLGQVVSSSSDPTVNNDNTQGYAAGWIWTNTQTGRFFICRAAATGAAVWDVMTYRSHPGYTANNWYVPNEITQTGTITPGNTTLYTFSMVFEERCTIHQLAARVTTAQAAQNFQLGIYKNNVATDRPTGTPLSNTGNISTASTIAIGATLGADVQVEPSLLYWLALMTSSTTAAFNGVSAQSPFFGSKIGSATLANVIGSGATIVGLTVTGQVFNSWPDLTSASFNEVQSFGVAHILYQVGSVP